MQHKISVYLNYIFGKEPVKVKMPKQVTYCTSSTCGNPAK